MQSHELSLRSRPVIRPQTSPTGGTAMNNLKLRVLPYAGVLTVIASLAGYYGGR